MRTPRPVLPLLAAGVAAAILGSLAPGASAQVNPAPSPPPSASPTTSPVVPPTTSPTTSPVVPPSATPLPPAPVLAPVLRLSTSVAAVVAGGSVAFTGKAVDALGRPVAGERLDLLTRTGGTSAVVVLGRMTTGADGRGTLVRTPRTSSEYVLRRVGTPTAMSDKRIVHVQPRLTAATTPAQVAVGSAAVVRGVLAPAYAGARLQVQRRFADGAWRRVGVVGTSATGAYAWQVRPGVPGRYVFRAVLPATQAHRGVTTPAVALTALADPTLRQGDRGPAVAVLERRLAAQKADVGPLDGVFDSDLRHGLTAWQKSQGLPRTGVYDARTRTRLASPAALRMRSTSRGRAVEVDLTQQVLYLLEGGVVQRIVDVSTGNDKPYTVDGVTYRATTPVGRFRISRKIDGVRVSRLGELYRPAYFVQGWAVHGSPSVPIYPASHGCVRVTNRAMDRLYPLLTIGTPVTVYRS